MKSTDLPDNVLRRMAPTERAKLGDQVQTSEEAMRKFVARSEKELQDKIAQFLNLRGIWHDRDAMHKRRMGTLGAADFQFPYKGRWVSWEVKYDKGRLNPDQERARDAVLRQGGHWMLITSLEQARAHLEAIA